MRARTWRSAVVTTAVAAAALAGATPAAAHHGRPLRVPLSGAEEVPVNPHGEADRATAAIRLDARRGRVCWRIGRLTLSPGDALPTAAHIHRAPRGQAGPVVVTLFGPDQAPAAYPTAATCVPAAPALVREIRANLAGFYVNLHNAQHPTGVVRGQLDAHRKAAKADRRDRPDRVRGPGRHHRLR